MSRKRPIATVFSIGGVTFGQKPMSDDEWKHGKRAPRNRVWYVLAQDGTKHRCKSYQVATLLARRLNSAVSWQEELRHGV